MLGLKKKNAAAASSDTSSPLFYSSASKCPPELTEKLLKCMNILMEIAVQSNRNVILDQVKT